MDFKLNYLYYLTDKAANTAVNITITYINLNYKENDDRQFEIRNPGFRLVCTTV